MTSIQQYALNIFRKAPAGIDVLAYLGGGCLRSFYDGTPVKDYDLFFASYHDWLFACQWFRADTSFVETTLEGEQTYPSFQREGEPPFNLIGFRFHKGAEALCNSFDFTCVALVAEIVEPDVVTVTQHPLAPYHASHKLLSFQNLQHIDRVERRKARYMGYGYKETPEFTASLPKCAAIPREASGGDY
ncbi:hypothetical protein [Dyella silvatica]|uniref:hypothetical protein n=1 Tax=Dyella silvatica TaxID=2992128 RepID=UPI0022537CAC|nr:hypothetical protein [Dyella silvatica]